MLRVKHSFRVCKTIKHDLMLKKQHNQSELHNKSVLHNHGDGGIKKHVNRASRLVNINRCTNYYNYYSFYDRKLSECMLKPHLPATW